MFGNNANMKQMMKQVQKMQANMAKVQEELGEKTVSVTVGGGAVKVVISGHLEVKEIKINPEAVDSEDMSMLEDMVLTAVNDALKKAQDMANEEMSKVTGGLNIPGMPGLF